MLPDACHLSHEVQVLHLQFFRRPAPQGLIEAYLKFHAESTKDELRTVATVVNNGLDALGMEPWLRGGSSRHLLSRKLLLIAYLAECDAAHLESSRGVQGRWRSFVQLCVSTLTGSGHLLKGRFQKALHGLL
jgi:hypothetical protein